MSLASLIFDVAPKAAELRHFESASRPEAGMCYLERLIGAPEKIQTL